MIFLGLLFPRNKEKVIKEKSFNRSVQNQANTFQWNFIDGLYANIKNGLKIINALPVGTFPFQYKDLFLSSQKWEYENEIHYQIGTINLPFLKQFSRYKKIKKCLHKLKDKKICIYSTYLPFLKAVQNLDSSYHIQLIVTDIPEYYDYSGKVNIIRKFFRERNNKAIYKYLKRVDSFVLLTEEMKKPLGVGARPYTIIEGIGHVCLQKQIDNERNESEKKIILYTGALERKFGLDVLLKAFSFIKNDKYELWICGNGDYVKEIKLSMQRDERIKFFGYVSKDEAEKKQAQASILVNPRQNNGEYTKYSFPSKTMEYLISGKPVVAYKLDGIPDEYDKFIRYVSQDSPQALAEEMIKICELSLEEREKIGRMAREFILRNKNAKSQTQKSLNLFK